MLSQLWSYKLSKIHDAYAHSGSIFNDMLYLTISSFADGGSAIVELNPESGKGRDIFSYKGSVQVSLFDAGHVYMTESGNLLCYNWLADKLLFQQTLPVNFAGRMLVSGSSLYVGIPEIAKNADCQKGVYCINKDNGKMKWHAAPDSPLYGRIHQHKDDIIFGSGKGIHSVGPDGKVKYVVENTAYYDPVVMKDTLFTGGANGLMLLDVDTGMLLDSADAPARVDNMCELNDAVICDAGDELCRYDIKDKKIRERWRMKLSGKDKWIRSEILYYKGYLYFIDGNKRLNKVDFKTGSAVSKRFDVKGGTLDGDILIHGNNFILLTTTGQVRCFDLRVI